MSNKITRIDFISACPAINCDNLSKNEWSHRNCGGKQWLDDKGTVTCKMCKKAAPLISWKFRCKGHQDFRETNKEKICEILSISSSIESANLKFKSRLLRAVSEMMDDDDDKN